MSRGRHVRWTEAADALLAKLWGAGTSGSKIAVALQDEANLVVCDVTVFARARKLGLPRRRRHMSQNQKAVSHRSVSPHQHQATPGPYVAPEALRAMREYLSAPRPLTAELMGDPRPGRSALDQRSSRG